MNEARRFFRYVIPGLVFATQLIIVLGLLRPDWIPLYLGELKTDSGIGLVFATILASGGVGMLFSSIHHTWHWKKGTTMDHTKVLKRLEAKGILKAEDTNFKDLCREDAWIILTALWHERLGCNKTIGSADPKVADLLDLVHSIGTSWIAALAATIVAFAVAALSSQFDLTGGPIIRFIIASILAFVVPWILYSNYSHTARLAQGVIDQVLSDALVTEGQVSAWPLLPSK